jgi:hypothetical protein
MANQISFMMDWQQQMLRDLTNASRGSLLQTSLVESQQTQQELQQGPNHRGEDQFTLPSIGPVDPTPVFSVPSLIDNSLDYKRTTELVQVAVKTSGMKRGMSQMEWGNVLRRIHTDWHWERWANVGTAASVLYKEVNTFHVNYEVGNNPSGDLDETFQWWMSHDGQGGMAAD